MDVLLKILLAIAIIIAILIMALMVFLFYPFRYDIDVTYDEKILLLTFKYSIVYFFLSFDFSSPVKCRLELFSKKIFDSESSKKSKDKKEVATHEEEVVSPAEFVEDVKDAKETVRDLFASAKKMEDKQKAERKIDSRKLESLVDRFEKFIPNDTIYVLKKILKELKNTLIFIIPKKYKAEIIYGIQDPYAMGLSYMITAPISIMGDKNVDIKPKFMVDTFKGHIHMSNRMPKVCILMPVIRLLLDKRFREIIFRN